VVTQFSAESVERALEFLLFLEARTHYCVESVASPAESCPNSKLNAVFVEKPLIVRLAAATPTIIIDEDYTVSP
jgi:hypothetical protein